MRDEIMTAVLELTKRSEVNGKKYATTIAATTADTSAYERARNTNCRRNKVRNNII